MIKSTLLTAAALFAVFTADAGMTMPAPRTPVATRGFALSGEPNNCTITVAFTSYGAGIDGQTRARIERMLRLDRRVSTFTGRPWGREGEVTLCIRLVRLRDVYRVGREIQRLVPARPRGPIEIRYPRRMPAPD